MLALKAGGRGDVTKSHLVWSYPNGPDVPSPVMDGAYVYVVENNGYLRALQLSAGSGGVPTLASVATSSAKFGYTSGSPIITSDGSDATDGLIWVVKVSGADSFEVEIGDQLLDALRLPQVRRQQLGVRIDF